MWTIGHGSRTISSLLSALEPLDIDTIVDVRSSPYSRYQPEFNREPFSAILRRDGGPGYVYMGDVLGGRPNDPVCYVDGLVDYTICRTRDWFHEGVQRLEQGIEEGYRIALMCSEAKPESCHRTKLIGVELAQRGHSVGHVDPDGSVVSQKSVIDRLTGGQQVFFDDRVLRTSRKRYGSQGSEQS